MNCNTILEDRPKLHCVTLVVLVADALHAEITAKHDIGQDQRVDETKESLGGVEN